MPKEVRKIGAAGGLAVLWAVLCPAQTTPKPDLAASIESSRDVAFRETVTISVTVTNKGTAPSPEALGELIVRNARPPRQILKKSEKKIRKLEPRDSFTFTSPLKPGLGMYDICATVDPKNKIPEEEETNNKACLTLIGK